MTDKMKSYIETAIADGELEPQEIQFLRRKAEELGDDPDEVEMTAKAEMAYFKKQNAKKSDKHGEIIKCPSCGSNINKMQTKCPECEHEFKNIEGSNSVHRLMDLLEKVEKEFSQKEVKTVKMFGMEMPIDSQATTNSAPYKARARIISTFPVPNTKEDILEFLTLAYAQAGTKSQKGYAGYVLNMMNGGGEKIEREAWITKCKQMIIKGRILFKNDASSLEIVNYYAKLFKLK